MLRISHQPALRGWIGILRSLDHLSDDEESLLLQQQLTIRKKGIFNSRSREKAFVAENIEEESKGPVVHNFEYIYFPRGVVHAFTRISGILYTCLTFRIKVRYPLARWK